MNRLERLKKMLEEDSKDSFVRFAIAIEYKSLEKYETAISQFEELKKTDAEYVGLYYHLAACYAEEEKYEKALSTYRQGIKVAEALNDQHAKSELMNAKMNLELEMDFE